MRNRVRFCGERCEGRARRSRAGRTRQHRVGHRLGGRRSRPRLRRCREGARPAGRQAGVPGVAPGGARFCGAPSPPRHQVRVQPAGRRHRRHHARSGRSVEARLQSAARGRPRRAVARRPRREERARPRCGRRHPRHRRRRAESVSRLPGPCRRRRRPGRDDLRAIASAEDQVRPQGGRRHHGAGVDPRRSRRHRHRRADAALQVARAALLVSHHLSGADGTDPRQDPPAAWTPRRRRPRSGRRRRISSAGSTRIGCWSPAPTCDRRRRASATSSSCSGPVS